MTGTYDVVLLVEQELSAADASRIHSLHEDIEEPVVYHVLLPLEDAAERIESAMGTLAAGEVIASPAMVMDQSDLEAVRRDAEERSRHELDQSLVALRGSGATAQGTVITVPPVDALATKVQEVEAGEAVIVTRPHIVAEFFHVDWSSKARRKLGVPVLHLLEHENFDEQAGEGEGITGV